MPTGFINESEIELTFPTAFNLGAAGTSYSCSVAYAPAVCVVSATSSNVLSITQIASGSLSSHFTADIQVASVASNPANAGETSDSFSITTKWGGITIDTTAAAATKSYTSQTVESITLDLSSITPVNVNTPALYNFPVTAGASGFPADSHLVLSFDRSRYGVLVADPGRFSCKTTGLVGTALSCTQRRPAELVISGFDAVAGGSALTIVVGGIIKFEETNSNPIPYMINSVDAN